MQTELLKARVADLADMALKSGAPRFLGFLTPEEAEFVKGLGFKGTVFSFFGGYENAERVFLCVHSADMDVKHTSYPIDAVTVTFRERDTLSHRDFLGSLMSKGIKRETVGDILVENGRAVMFVGRDISKYVCEQTDRIGRVGVQTEKGYTEPLPLGAEKTVSSHTVASLRLDCVVAALVNLSRDKSAKFIADGFVCVNSVISQKPTKMVSAGDKITVRGYGKFTVISADGVTRKGRTVLIAEKYK